MKKSALVALCTVAGVLGPVSMAVATPVSAYAAQPVLKYGDSGTVVKTLQSDLNAKGYSCGQVDGGFGNATLAAVKAFQKASGLQVDGVVGNSTWSLLTKSSSSSGSSNPTPPVVVAGKRVLQKKVITFNGKTVSSPMGFTDQGTAYMPIFYVQQMLKTIGIENSWDGVHWNLTVPSTMKPDMSNIQAGTGRLQISINGTLVKKVDGIAYPDPASNVMTTYMPIWYLMGVLDRLGFQKTWDGTNWVMTNTQAYFAIRKDGTQIGQFPAQADAQNALSNVPGGIVKDAVGNVVFTEPDFAAYTSPVSTPQEFTTQVAASNAVTGNNNGYVVDLLTNAVVQPPAEYNFVGPDGSWRSSTTGVVGPTAPAFAQSGSKYLTVTTSNGHQYYLLSQSDGKYSGKLVGTDQNPFESVDLRFPSPASVTADQIDQWFQSKQSPLAGLGASFISAQNKYGVNATYLLSHAILETAWGKSSIAQAKNNLFGYGAYDADPTNAAGNYPSDDYAIQYEAWVVRQNYLEPTGPFYYQSPTLPGMNHYYATDPNWNSSIASLMAQYVSQTGGSQYDYRQSAPGQVGPIAQVSQEPVYMMSGAKGGVTQYPYGNLPVFPDSVTGANQMFLGTMKNGSSGATVKTLQRAIGVTADGSFGPMTQAALQSYQQAHGLPVTGVCDLQTWQTIVPAPALSLPAGTSVAVDSMEQGLVGGYVTEWYHVTAGSVSGWVDSQYVAFTNMYRVEPVSGYTAKVYSAPSSSATVTTTMHVGDYTVCNNINPVSGFIQVQFVNASGQPTVGYLDSSAVQLTVVAPPAPVTAQS